MSFFHGIDFNLDIKELFLLLFVKGAVHIVMKGLGVILAACHGHLSVYNYFSTDHCEGAEGWI